MRCRARAVISAAAAGERAPMASRHPEDARSKESAATKLGARYCEKASFFFPSRKQNLGRLRPPTLKDWGARAAHMAAQRPSHPNPLGLGCEAHQDFVFARGKKNSLFQYREPSFVAADSIDLASSGCREDMGARSPAAAADITARALHLTALL